VVCLSPISSMPLATRPFPPDRLDKAGSRARARRRRAEVDIGPLADKLVGRMSVLGVNTPYGQRSTIWDRPAQASRGSHPPARLSGLALRCRQARSHPVDQDRWGGGAPALPPRRHRALGQRRQGCMEPRTLSATDLRRSAARFTGSTARIATAPATVVLAHCTGDRCLGRLRALLLRRFDNHVLWRAQLSSWRSERATRSRRRFSRTRSVPPAASVRACSLLSPWARRTRSLRQARARTAPERSSRLRGQAVRVAYTEGRVPV
jgi:hypothetical protein